MSGGQGDDLVRGDAGDDLLKGGAGSDRILGGTQNDTIVSVGDRAGDVVDCVAGTDTVTADRYDRVSGCEKVSRV